VLGSHPASVSNGVTQILTSEYLVEGHLQNPEILNARDSDFWNMREAMFTSGVWLTTVTVQPTGNYAVAAQSLGQAVRVCGDALVAVIPRDEASLALIRKNNAAWRYPLPAEVYAGPYVIRGTVLGKGNNLGAFDWDTFLMRDVEISSVLPNSAWTGLKAPCAYVGGQHKHFITSLA